MACWPQESRREGSFQGRKEGEQDQSARTGGGRCGWSLRGASAPMDPGLRAPATHTPHPGPLALLSFYFILFSLLQHFCLRMDSGAAISGLCSAAGTEKDGVGGDVSLRAPHPRPQGRTPGPRTGWPWSPPSPGDPLPHSPLGTRFPLLIARSTFCHGRTTQEREEEIHSGFLSPAASSILPTALFLKLSSGMFSYFRLRAQNAE